MTAGVIRRRATALALVAASALAAASAAAAASSKTVATVTTADYRSVVVATKSSGGGAPTAAVTVDTFGRAVGGHWQRVGARRLAGPFFWKTVTAPHALCRLEIVTASSPRVTVQLLRTPSLGCARAETIPIPAR